MQPEQVNESLLYGSRWECLSVHLATKLGSAYEMVLKIGVKVEGRDVAFAANNGGPSAVMDLLAIPGAQLQQRLLEAEAELAKVKAERDVLKSVLIAQGKPQPEGGPDAT